MDIDIANAARLLTLIVGAIAGGAMLRFYWTRRSSTGMPSAATVAFFLMLFYMLRGTVASWGQPWEWMKTPVALAASVTVIIGVAPFLQFKRHPQEKDR